MSAAPPPQKPPTTPGGWIKLIREVEEKGPFCHSTVEGFWPFAGNPPVGDPGKLGETNDALRAWLVMCDMGRYLPPSMNGLDWKLFCKMWNSKAELFVKAYIRYVNDEKAGVHFLKERYPKLEPTMKKLFLTLFN